LASVKSTVLAVEQVHVGYSRQGYLLCSRDQRLDILLVRYKHFTRKRNLQQVYVVFNPHSVDFLMHEKPWIQNLTQRIHMIKSM
jgi:hypothetical protein